MIEYYVEAEKHASPSRTHFPSVATVIGLLVSRILRDGVHLHGAALGGESTTRRLAIGAPTLFG